MTDEARTPARQPLDTPVRAGASRIRSRWLLLTLAGVLTGGVVLILLFVWNPFRREQPGPPGTPFDVEMVVAISSADRSKDGVQLEEAGGALPVRAGEWMRLTVRFTEPAYCCCLWIDGQGNVVPLYPWNDGAVEVKEANTPPPARHPTRLLFSPVNIGSGWKFGRHGGLVTLLLLARRTPPVPDLRLGDLLTGMPPARMRAPNELAVLRFDRDESAASTVLARDRGSEADAQEIDRPLLERMEKLRDKFELVRAVRFPHESE
jgi:hypothetical protein